MKKINKKLKKVVDKNIRIRYIEETDGKSGAFERAK